MSIMDYETFNKLKERMKAKFPTLLEGYLQNSKNYLAIIDTNLPNGDLNALIEAAHSMKSASGLLGILNVHKAAETLEYAGKNLLETSPANFEKLRPDYEILQSAFSEVEGDLQSELIKSKQA